MFVFAQPQTSRARFRGFTMIELMVVIGILGIVAAIGIPAIGRVMKKEGMRKAVSDLVEACADARATAILKEKTATLTIQREEHTFKSPSKSFQFPDNVEIIFMEANFTPTPIEEETKVNFFSNGTSDEFTIALRSEEMELVEIELEVVTGLPRVKYK